MNVLPLIEAKRDSGVLSDRQIRDFVVAVTAGDVPDYQVASWLMAVFFRGLNAAETRSLTRAMRDSGEVLAFPNDPSRPVVDKHSTGGIGDKVSLPLAPLLACLGFRVPMISGRGLGITGGTLDKLDSIPGFRTRLTAAEIMSQVDRVGCVFCGQTETMCPADRILYSLRDATGTVPSLPLITASILSKKLAEGLEALVLDVKFGSAAFMSTREAARQLAQSMVAIAGESGVRVRALLTDMNTPLGSAAGNWLEVKESVACLEGQGRADLMELIVDGAAHLLVLTGKNRELGEARARTLRTLDSGAALQKWNEMLAAQGTDMAAFRKKLAQDGTAPVVKEVRASRSGFLRGADARIVGEVIRDLGGGRMTKESAIDFDVGVDGLRESGDAVAMNESLCRVHARTRAEAEAAAGRLAAAFAIVEAPVPKSPRVVEVL